MVEKKKNTVLIIDDDRLLLDMYSVKFREKGFDVEPVATAGDALKCLQQGLTPIAIVLDIIMPAMDGFEFLEALKKERLGSNPVIVVLSNHNEKDGIDRAKKLGAHSYIVKASTIPSDVVTKVIDAIEQNR